MIFIVSFRLIGIRSSLFHSKKYDVQKIMIRDSLRKGSSSAFLKHEMKNHRCLIQKKMTKVTNKDAQGRRNLEEHDDSLSVESLSEIY